MRSSPVVHSVLTQSDSFSKPSHSGRNSCDSEIQLDTVDELQSDKSSFKECNLGDETGNFGLCTESNTYSSRFQLEQDVNRLQQQLQEEMELHAVLEKAIEKNAMKLSSPSHLPHQAQELLSNIALLEVTVSKLEQDMESLHFQLSQERNERRLAEYRLRHSSFPSIPRCSSDILNKLISPSLRCSKHSISIVGDAREDNSSQELQGHWNLLTNMQSQ
uniref:Ternary complex factor MIP1 leucine-zipper domain-containing protein n=3 Tax=Quercus lobata TaxID=97700 RepID=A0A7N2L7B0_QUELO